MPEPRGVVSIGIAAALGTAAAAVIAPAVESAGLNALWVNDTPDADALAVLAAAADTTQNLVLATGVLAVDRRPAAEIVAAVRRLGLPEHRLVLGVGAGAGGPGSLARVREAVEILSAETAATILVGALGPRMRLLGAQSSSGVLLSWLTPQIAAEQAAEAHAVDPAARAVLYARAIIDPRARSVLEEEAARYAGFPSYAANLARLGISAIDTTLPRSGDEGLAPGVRAYLDGVDELVLRAITAGPDVAEYLRFVDIAARDLVT